MKNLRMIAFTVTLALISLQAASAQGSIEVIGQCALPNRGNAMEGIGNYLFIACDSSGLQVVDVADPENPVIVSTYPTPHRALDLCLAGNYAYIADFSTLQILDISDPLSPQFVGSYQSERVFSVHVGGDYAFIGRAYYTPSFDMVDISDPTDPEFVSGLLIYGGVFDLYYSNDYLCVLSNVTEPYSNYLRVIDISDPINPFIAGNVMLGGDVEIPGRMMIDDSLAYIANRSSGLEIVDVSDAQNPELIGSCVTFTEAISVYVADLYAIVADYHHNIQIIDVSNPADPFFWDIGYLSNPALTVFGSYSDVIYVTTTDSLVIFQDPQSRIKDDPEKPRDFSLLQNYPNPFNATTTISYSLPAQSDIRIEIYNILGQQVETLFEGNKQAGYHTITWHADDYPSGVYFARMEAEAKTENIKMVLLK